MRKNENVYDGKRNVKKDVVGKKTVTEETETTEIGIGIEIEIKNVKENVNAKGSGIEKGTEKIVGQIITLIWQEKGRCIGKGVNENFEMTLAEAIIGIILLQ